MDLEALAARQHAFGAASALLLLLIPLWIFLASPELLRLPKNFAYSAEVFSLDNFYDEQSQRFSGAQISKSVLSYEAVSAQGGVLLVRNSFSVKTLTGEPIFSVNRLHAIDTLDWTHVEGAGDRAREGYLFAPRWLFPPKDFIYWHANYDSPAFMKFEGDETVQGLRVYKFHAFMQSDQTKNLGHLPGVPEERGVQLDTNLFLWVEPVSGWLVKYEDYSTAYYYDIATKRRLHPWNSFHNEFTHLSIEGQVANASRQRDKVLAATLGVPILLMVASVSMAIFISSRPGSNNRVGELK